MPGPGADRADVLVRGAGPVGCTLALALAGSPHRVRVVDSSPEKSLSFRPIALSYASRLILERIGAWGAFGATSIETVQVSQQGGFGRTGMDAADAGVPALGYVADYRALTAALRALVQVEHQDRTALCTVHAEGGSEDQTEKRYAQDAVVGIVRTDPPASTTAFERFTPEGPLALLPFDGTFAMVWSASPERARALSKMDESAFLAELARAAGRHIGRPRAVEARAVQPLALRVRAARVAERAVYIGNAAQTLHPVAGQGLNLGLRDAWDLAQILRDVKDPGEPAALERYAARRRLDAAATIRATDLLAGTFTGNSRVARLARGIGLAALDILPGPRRFFARRMIFGPSALP